MSDDDFRGQAWRVTPSDYISQRLPAHSIAQPVSLYLAMRDGCRLAVDVYLPDGTGAAGTRWPTIQIMTPYYRRFRVKDDSAGTEACPGIAAYRDTFVPRGYALVVIDVRGTGASFGTRDSFRSPAERLDHAEIADWTVKQSWSNGRIGATGISYLGAASDFLASTGHPAVKAIAPLFSVWDTYADNYYPGGLLVQSLARDYGAMMDALDNVKGKELERYSTFRDTNLDGPHPVDEDQDGRLLEAALKEHRGNFRMPDLMAEFRFRDEPLPYDSAFTVAALAPSNYADGIREDVAVYSVSGWTDGAGYCNGVISRHLTLENTNKHLLIGPWDHGAKVNTSPWRSEVTPRFPLMAEVLRFFDQYLAEMETGLRDEEPVHYFVMHDEVWRSASSWPPTLQAEELFLGPDRRLVHDAPDEGGAAYKVDPSTATGRQTRYERISGLDCVDYYADWQGRDACMLTYTSDPLPKDLQLCGHAVLSLNVRSSEPDAAIFAYLSEVQQDGQVQYVTEGMLRALHRKESSCPENYRTTWPYHSCSRHDAAPMPIDGSQRIRFALLPVAWTLRQGSRLRLSIAGADVDHFAQVPHGRLPSLTVLHGKSGSLLSLPLSKRGDC